MCCGPAPEIPPPLPSHILQSLSSKSLSTRSSLQSLPSHHDSPSTKIMHSSCQDLYRSSHGFSFTSRRLSSNDIRTSAENVNTSIQHSLSIQSLQIISESDSSHPLTSSSLKLQSVSQNDSSCNSDGTCQSEDRSKYSKQGSSLCPMGSSTLRPRSSHCINNGFSGDEVTLSPVQSSRALSNGSLNFDRLSGSVSSISANSSAEPSCTSDGPK